jgi:hypothetical protein
MPGPEGWMRRAEFLMVAFVVLVIALAALYSWLNGS